MRSKRMAVSPFFPPRIHLESRILLSESFDRFPSYSLRFFVIFNSLPRMKEIESLWTFARIYENKYLKKKRVKYTMKQINRLFKKLLLKREAEWCFSLFLLFNGEGSIVRIFLGGKTRCCEFFFFFFLIFGRTLFTENCVDEVILRGN